MYFVTSLSHSDWSVQLIFSSHWLNECANLRRHILTVPNPTLLRISRIPAARHSTFIMGQLYSLFDYLWLQKKADIHKRTFHVCRKQFFFLNKFKRASEKFTNLPHPFFMPISVFFVKLFKIYLVTLSV
jgi:hypothetical protein